MYRAFGERIRLERERAGLTQPQLGALVGVSGRTVGNWERGEASPRNSLARLMDVLPGLKDMPLPAEAVAEIRPAPELPHNAVLDAIDADPYLLPEAKEHLLNQYGLLRRIAGTPDGQAHRPVARSLGNASPAEYARLREQAKRASEQNPHSRKGKKG